MLLASRTLNRFTHTPFPHTCDVASHTADNRQSSKQPRVRHATMKTMLAAGDTALDSASGDSRHHWSEAMGVSPRPSDGGSTSDAGSSPTRSPRTKQSHERGRYLRHTASSAAHLRVRKAGDAANGGAASNRPTRGPSGSSPADHAKQRELASAQYAWTTAAAAVERSAKLQGRAGVVAPARNIPGAWHGAARNRARSRAGTGGDAGSVGDTSPSVASRARGISDAASGSASRLVPASPTPRLYATSPAAFSSPLRTGMNGASPSADGAFSLSGPVRGSAASLGGGRDGLDDDPTAHLAASDSAARQELAALLAAVRDVRRGVAVRDVRRGVEDCVLVSGGVLRLTDVCGACGGVA